MIGRLEYVLECKLSPDKNILAYVCKRERSRVVEFCPVVKKKKGKKKEHRFKHAPRPSSTA